ncbi:D-threo-3-hydroxyaspartate dehydratase (D-THA DH) (D-THA dehydratase) (Threo-3-hydroxy-D-aspartate ammonia-lyase), partial [Durusdinium trenchii]
MQRDAGAAGVTCSKVDEALVFLRAGFDVLAAFPVVTADKAQRLLADRASLHRLTVMVDSEHGLGAIVAAGRDVAPRIMMKVDSGLHRCGVAPGPRLEALGAQVAAAVAAGVVDFRGIFSHGGHAYAASSKEEVRNIADAESRLMRAARDTLASMGLRCHTVSVGSTLTELGRTDFAGLTEIRPGNYVFMDQTPLSKGLVEPHQIALSVVATVVSRNDTFSIIDAGSKTMTSDKGAHASSAPHFGICRCLDGDGPEFSLDSLSEEHGWIRHHGHPSLLQVGQRVLIRPQHSCPIVNLVDSFWLLDEETLTPPRR